MKPALAPKGNRVLKGICELCGQRTWPLSSAHYACRKKRAKLIQSVPEYFSKVAASDLDIPRFVELLSAVAQLSFVSVEELEALSGQAISTILLGMLESELVNGQTLKRLVDVSEVFFPPGHEPEMLTRLLGKLQAIHAVEEWTIKTSYGQATAWPELQKREKVVWVFNHVTAALIVAPSEDEVTGVAVDIASYTYIPLPALNNVSLMISSARTEYRGDLVLTDRNLYFFTHRKAVWRVPFRRIDAVNAFKTAITVKWEPRKLTAFRVDDPWFLANLLSAVLSRFAASPAGGATKGGFPRPLDAPEPG